MHLTHKQIGITLTIVISQRVLIITNDITRVVTRVFSPNIRYWQYMVHIIPSGPEMHGPLGTRTGSSKLVRDFHSSDPVWSDVFRVSWCAPVPNFHFWPWFRGLQFLCRFGTFGSFDFRLRIDFEFFVRGLVNHILYFFEKFLFMVFDSWFWVWHFGYVYYFGGVQRSVGYMDMWIFHSKCPTRH